MYLELGITEDSAGSGKYNKCSDIEFKKRGEDDAIPDEIFDAAICLDDCVHEPKYKDIKKLFFMGGEEEEENTKKKGDDDDDEEEEGDESEEDGDEEDEDDDDESDSDDEEGDDESNEDEEDSDDEEDDESIIEKGSRVAWRTEAGKSRLGTVESINRKSGLAAVQVDGREGKPSTAVDIEDLVLIDAEEEEEEEEEKPKKKKKPMKKAKGEDEDDFDF